MSTSVGADFPALVERLATIRDEARGHGIGGEMVAALCDLALRDARDAWEKGDVCDIVRAYAQGRKFADRGAQWLRRCVPHG